MIDPSLLSVPVWPNLTLKTKMKSTPVASLQKYHEVVAAIKLLTKMTSGKGAKHFTISDL